jgi:hypothetical protein
MCGGGASCYAGGDGDCVEIYVGNLSYDMTEAQMRKEFEKYGAVKSARIISNRFNHKSRGLDLWRCLIGPKPKRRSRRSMTRMCLDASCA